MHLVRITAAIVFLGASALPAFAADAIPAGKSGNVALGPHWGVYETYKGVAFRWIGNDAQIFVRGGPGLARLTIACAGGPSLGQPVFPLRVLDMQGRQVDHAQCAGKDQPAQLILPLGSGVATFVLHVDGGGRPVPGEHRILNAQIFSLTAAASGPTDVAGDGIRFADRWQPLETYQGETFRWMDGNDGRIVVTSDRDKRATLRLNVATGPSIGARATQLTIRSGSGTQVFRASVSGRRSLLVPVTLKRGDNAFTLDVTTANRPVAGDPRKLNLRIFSIVLVR